MKTITDYPRLSHDFQNRHIDAREAPNETGPIIWIFAGRWRMLDNFAPTPVMVDIGHGRQLYPTSEHAFAAAKASGKAQHDVIAGARNPGSAKALGRSCDLRKDWEDVKFEVMWQVLLAKFDQHPECVKLLRETGEREIYEGNTWGDEVWGVVYHPQDGLYWGRNGLGEMLMEVRDLYL